MIDAVSPSYAHSFLFAYADDPVVMALLRLKSTFFSSFQCALESHLEHIKKRGGERMINCVDYSIKICSFPSKAVIQQLKLYRR